MEYLKAFTDNMKEVENVDPIIESWLDSFLNMEKMMFEKIILLCRYFERIPDDAQHNYADLLIEALESFDQENEAVLSKSLNSKLCDFAKSLNDQGAKEKAEKLNERCQ